ncbi:translocation/assembly module TamB domain-containing protein [Chitinimonas sp. BJYL2]|uniref:translocation/assembly module TamB domain-containing protein n=1 Tax=Chitinimonas sp. BJYL2 TaxID=2976696 RepID=UPI0022B42F96|nr:translocation/assembly module TamB domain-containing protein [Chitinimonas sp. BJYL2]
MRGLHALRARWRQYLAGRTASRQTGQAASPAAVSRRFRLGPVWLELLLFMLVSGLAAFILLAASPTGTRGLFALAGQLSGGAFSVAQVQGSLWRDLVLLDIRVRTASADVRLDSARLRWQPLALLGGELRVHELALGAMAIRTRPSHEPTVVPDSLALPLSVRLQSATLVSLMVDQHPVLGSTRLRAESDGDHHQLWLDATQTPWFAASGQLRLDGHRPFAIRGHLGLQGTASDAPWQLAASLGGSLERLALKAQASGGPQGAKPFRGAMDLTLRPFASSHLGLLQAGRIDTEAMDLRVLSPRLPRTALDLQVQAQPGANPAAEQVRVDIALRNPLAGPLQSERLPLERIDARLQLDPARVTLQRFDARLGRGRLSLSGTAGTDQLALNALLEAIDLAQFGAPPMVLGGKIAVQGAPAQPRFQADIGDAQLRLVLDAALRGTDPAARLLKLESVRLLANRDGARGEVSLRGELGLAGKRRFVLDGQIKEFDPATLSTLAGHRIASGRIGATLSASGQLGAPVGGQFKLVLTPSRFNDQPLSGQATATLRGEVLQDVAVAAVLGPNRLNLQGGFGRKGDQLKVDIQMPDIGGLGPGFGGAATAQLTLAGNLRRPTIEGTARGDKLKLPGEVTLAHAELAARLDASPNKPANSPLTLRLGIDNLQAPKLTLARARFGIAGTQAAHLAELDGTGTLAGQAIDVRIRAAGALDQHTWRGRVEQLDSRGDWPIKLANPAQLVVQTSGGSLAGLDATILGGNLRISRLEWQGGQFAAKGELRAFALAEWVKRFPDVARRVDTDLVVAARFDLQGDKALSGNLVVEREAGDLALRVEDPSVKPMPLRLANARVQLDLAGHLAALALDLQSESFGWAKGRIATRFERTPAGWRPEPAAALEGRLQAEMPSLAWIGPLLGPTAKVEGKLAAEMSASGSNAVPRWFGRFNAQDVAVRMPDAGIHWHEGKVEATLDGDTAQLATLSLKAGKGGLTGAGRMALRDAGPEGALEVKFDHFAVLSRPDRNLVVSGNTSLGVLGEALTLTGKLTADEGYIEQIKSSAAVLGDDVIVLGRGSQTRPKPKPTPLTLKLDLDLGNRFVFKAYGLDARLSGSVRMSASPKQSLGGSGSLHVEEGRYAAYGQNLAITRGILTFQGPLDNPALDILAERKNLPVVVGVKILGTARAPSVSLTSDSGMTDAEKLSWLVLGRGSASGGGDADLLITAADALLSAGESVGLRQQMAGKLGLDDISLGRSDAYTDTSKTDAAGNALAGRVVSLGKRLSDRAYVSYEQSLDGVGYAVKLSYQLTRRVSVALTTGLTSSVDVLYSWTFD